MEWECFSGCEAFANEEAYIAEIPVLKSWPIDDFLDSFIGETKIKLNKLKCTVIVDATGITIQGADGFLVWKVDDRMPLLRRYWNADLALAFTQQMLPNIPSVKKALQAGFIKCNFPVD